MSRQANDREKPRTSRAGGGHAARRCNRGSGEQTGEVDDVEATRKIDDLAIEDRRAVLSEQEISGEWRVEGVENVARLSQRLTLTLSDDGGGMSAVLARSSDGKEWHHDLDMRFRKTG